MCAWIRPTLSWLPVCCKARFGLSKVRFVVLCTKKPSSASVITPTVYNSYVHNSRRSERRRSGENAQRAQQVGVRKCSATVEPTLLVEARSSNEIESVNRHFCRVTPNSRLGDVNAHLLLTVLLSRHSHPEFEHGMHKHLNLEGRELISSSRYLSLTNYCCEDVAGIGWS